MERTYPSPRCEPRASSRLGSDGRRCEDGAAAGCVIDGDGPLSSAHDRASRRTSRRNRLSHPDCTNARGRSWRRLVSGPRVASRLERVRSRVARSREIPSRSGGRGSFAAHAKQLPQRCEPLQRSADDSAECAEPAKASYRGFRREDARPGGQPSAPTIDRKREDENRQTGENRHHGGNDHFEVHCFRTPGFYDRRRRSERQDARDEPPPLLVAWTTAQIDHDPMTIPEQQGRTCAIVASFSGRPNPGRPRP